ncbi:MAG: class I SAM-dependent methyltransferase [bacterium]
MTSTNKYNLKRTIETIFRYLGLEPVIYHYVFRKDHRRFRQRDRVFAAAHPEAILPPPRLRFDVIACSSAEYYFKTGNVMAEQILSVIRQWVGVKTPVICEWGCGPGRILFPMEALDHDKSMTFIGTDAFAPSIHWAQTVPGGHRINFLLNKMDPPLALANSSVDFVYAVSVFTHLSESLTLVWFKEILRILKPGGIFWFSAHGGTFHRNDLDAASVAKLDRDEFVAIHSWHNGSQMYTGIHCPPLMKSIIAASGAELLDYQPGGNQKYQDAWIVRKRGE